MSKYRALAISMILVAIQHEATAKAIITGTVHQNEVAGPPQPHVGISAPGANRVETGEMGEFTLESGDAKPGEPVALSIQFPNWAVVNDMQLEREFPLHPEQQPVLILVSKASDRERWALRYYRLEGNKAVQETYRRKLNELQVSHVATLEERDRLRKERNEALEQLERIAQSAVTSVGRSQSYRRALKLFFDGKTDAALQLLNEDALGRARDAAQSALGTAQHAVEEAAAAYGLRGQILTSQFRFADAEKAYEQSVGIAQQSYRAWFEYGDFHRKLHHYARARDALDKALKLAEAGNRQSDVADALNNLGLVYWNQKNLEEAVSAHSRALALRRSVASKSGNSPDRDAVAQSLGNLANALCDQRQLPKAFSAFAEALAIRRDLSKADPAYRPSLAIMLNNFGALYKDVGRNDEALKLYREALSIRREYARAQPNEYNPNVATTLANIGAIVDEQGRHEEAIREYFPEALAIRREFAAKMPEVYKTEVANTLRHIGRAYRSNGQRSESIKAYQEAAQIYREYGRDDVDCRAALATILNTVGIEYWLEGDNDRALTATKEALSIVEDLVKISASKWNRSLADVLNNLGNIYSEREEYDAALSSYSRALSTYRDVGSTGSSSIEADIGRVERRKASLLRQGAIRR
jgi:tetratricopeptide (TPR) repeat protein